MTFFNIAIYDNPYSIMSFWADLVKVMLYEIVTQEDKMASYSLLKAKDGQLAQGIERTKKDKLSKRTMRQPTTTMYFERYGSLAVL
jgi:hypothetical protein